MAENNQTQTATIYYDSPRPVHIGDVFYRVEHGEGTYLKAPCRVCEGKREITVNGITFKCPMCDSETAVLNVSKYVVRRYRVYGIYDEVSTYEWKPSTVHRVKFKMYRKVGRVYVGWFGSDGGSLELSDDDIERKLNKTYDPSLSASSQTDAIFDDYKLACKFADAANAAELQRVADYNAEHGTEHVVTFKVENDPKSN